MNPELEYAEEWRCVIGFEGYYEVSNLGRVRSLARTAIYSNGGTRQHPGVLLRQCITTNYLKVRLSKDNRPRDCNVHCLVAEAFLGKRPLGEQINHKDGNKTNNVAWNLEYVTPKGNIRHAIALGLHPGGSPPGEKNPGAKLTDIEVIEIRRLYTEGFTQTALGKQFGVSQQQIGKIVRRERRRFNSEGKEI